MLDPALSGYPDWNPHYHIPVYIYIKEVMNKYTALTTKSQVYDIMLQEDQPANPATAVPAHSLEAMRVSTSCGDKDLFDEEINWKLATHVHIHVLRLFFLDGGSSSALCHARWSQLLCRNPKIGGRRQDHYHFLNFPWRVVQTWFFKSLCREWRDLMWRMPPIQNNESQWRHFRKQPS